MIYEKVLDQLCLQKETGRSEINIGWKLNGMQSILSTKHALEIAFQRKLHERTCNINAIRKRGLKKKNVCYG